MIPLSWYLLVAAALFCIGLFGVLARKNAIAILMGIELMLNAVNINLLAFWSYLHNDAGQRAGFRCDRLYSRGRRDRGRAGPGPVSLSPARHGDRE